MNADIGYLSEKKLTDYLKEVEDFTINEYIPALAKGGSIRVSEKQEIAQQVTQYSGIKEKHVLDQNLILPRNFFWKDL